MHPSESASENNLCDPNVVKVNTKGAPWKKNYKKNAKCLIYLLQNNVLTLF